MVDCCVMYSSHSLDPSPTIAVTSIPFNSNNANARVLHYLMSSWPFPFKIVAFVMALIPRLAIRRV